MTRIKIKSFKQLKEEGWKLRGEFMHPANNPYNGIDEVAFNYLGTTSEATRYNDTKFMIPSNEYGEIYIPVSAVEEIYGDTAPQIQRNESDTMLDISRAIERLADLPMSVRWPQPNSGYCPSCGCIPCQCYPERTRRAANE